MQLVYKPTLYITFTIWILFEAYLEAKKKLKKKKKKFATDALQHFSADSTDEKINQCPWKVKKKTQSKVAKKYILK